MGEDGADAEETFKGCLKGFNFGIIEGVDRGLSRGFLDILDMTCLQRVQNGRRWMVLKMEQRNDSVILRPPIQTQYRFNTRSINHRGLTE